MAAPRRARQRCESPRPSVEYGIALHWKLSAHSARRRAGIGTGRYPNPIVSADDLLGDLAPRLSQKRLVVWDRVQGIPAALDTAKAPLHTPSIPRTPCNLPKADAGTCRARTCLGNSVFEAGNIGGLWLKVARR